MITLVTSERFLGICYPLKHRLLAGKQRTARLIAGSWLLSIIMGILFSLLSFKLKVYCIIWPKQDTFTDFPTEFGRCQALDSHLAPYLRVFFTLTFFLVTFGNIIMYVLIMRQMHKRIKSRGNSAIISNALQDRNSVGKMLILNGLVFFICQTPFQVISVITLIGDYVQYTKYTTEHLAISLWIISLLLCINSMINPLIYNISNPRCRKAFKYVFTGKYFCKRKKDEGAQISMSLRAVRTTNGDTLAATKF